MSNKKILIEFHGWKVECVGYYFILKVLKEKFNSSIEAFITYPSFFSINYFNNFIDLIKIFLGQLFSINTFGFFKSLGGKKIFKPNIKNKHRIKAINFYKKFFKKSITKKKILHLKINQVIIGDVMYDSYLKSYNKPTINVHDKHFLIFFKNFLSLFYYWEDYFNTNNVKAVIVMHDTYLTGIPLRIAVARKIKSIVLANYNLYQINKKNLYPLKEFLNYRNDFKSFDKQFQKKSISFAKKKLREKLRGDSYFIPYVHKTSYSSNFYKNKILNSSKKFKVIILPHSFIDSPNVYGGSLFPDFYEWLNFIFKISKNTNYEWYIKLGPDFDMFNDPTYSIIKNMVSANPHIKWIEHGVPHNKIIKEGINAAITIHGTVGSEYPYFKIPVINSSLNNPHVKYNFNFHPKTIKELENLIYNLPTLKHKIKITDICEFFFMHKILSIENWLRINMYQFIKDSGGSRLMYKNEDSYYKLMSRIESNSVINSLKFFLDTNDYILNYKYYEKFNLNKIISQ